MLAAGLICALGVGCGEGEGAADGATVTAYVEAPLCDGASPRVVAVAGEGGETTRVRFACLPDPRGERGLDLATIGANARRASEDSATVAFLEAASPAVNRFSHPILEAAGIGWVTSSSGNRAMQQVLDAVASSDPNSLRGDVRETLESR